ncbi:MAG: tyrosine--tRNA ligase [Candidatus Levybacteria bacterium]|nr:tyrosine--tRNA ligase [Candidatus Levybacteria bacterium]
MMDKIEEVLTRGVEKVYPSKEELEKVLSSGKKIRLYQGFDPTGTQLHIGHMAGLMKLRQFQKLGHHVIFLIGDGTGQAGDPSGRTAPRENFYSNEELRTNAKDYVLQASKIVDFEGDNPAEILYNSDWLNKLNLVDILNIAGHFSLQQLEERDLFAERKKKGETINMREFFYPFLQGYDSVAMNVDLEIGGSDQMFNMMCGRQLVKEVQGREKFVLTTPLLSDSQGNKIGKSEGNVIALTALANDFYGMIMSAGDDLIIKLFTCLTAVPLEEIEEMEKQIKSGENPMIFKKKLAFTLTEMLNDKNSAQEAQEEFEKIFQKREAPEDNILNFETTKTKMNIIDLLTESNLAPSRSEAKRLIEQKAVDIDNKVVDNVREEIRLQNGMIVKVGKRKFSKIMLK